MYRYPGLNSLGLVLFKIGLHDLAMQSFVESLRLRRELLGDTHRDVAIIIYNIATIFLEQGNDSEAMKCYRETLRVERLALGDDHEDVLLTITYIAQVNQNKGDLQAALACYEGILRSQKRSRPEDHESIARTLNRMANIHLQSGHPCKVVELMTEASRRMRLAGLGVDELSLSGFHLYGFSRVHPEASSAA
jgi:Tetratricopeptide repeat